MTRPARLAGLAEGSRPALVEASMARPVTLVWIDSREAIISRRIKSVPALTRIRSDVPAHHRSTGHLRHDPAVRHGGGAAQTAGEPRRLERLARFLQTVANVVPPDDDLLVLGPGTVHEHLARLLTERDTEHRARRTVTTQAAARMTRRQLVASHRRVMADEPRRRSVAASRGSGGEG